MRKKRRQRPHLEYKDAELNIMPFIDVFSVLNTFLLFSAVFIALGTIKVQIPYLTNKEVDENKPKRSMSVKVTVQKEKMELASEYSLPPIQRKKTEYQVNEAGIAKLHSDLVLLRTQEPKTDLVTLYSDDDVVYEVVIGVLDAIKMRQKGDPEIVSEDPSKPLSKEFIFPKVVMGSVIL